MKRIAVVGGGTMGRGIAEALLEAGREVTLVSRGAEKIAKLREKMKPYGDSAAITDDPGACAGCDPIIEAVSESSAAKEAVIRRVSTIAPGAIIASTTSSIPVSILEPFCADPSRFIGLHFFNPAKKMKGVEVIPGAFTSPQTLASALDFIAGIGREPVVVKDGPGFVTTRLLMAYFVEAMRMAAEEHDPQAVDDAMTKCVKMAMGPCAMMDLIGLDVISNILKIMNEEGRTDRFTPPPFVAEWVRSGRLGRKTGAGFFEYAREGV